MHKQYNIHIPSFKLETGEQTGDLEVACCLYGQPDHPVVAVMGGISADRWLFDGRDQSVKGWWQQVLSQSEVLNQHNFCFLSFEYFSFSENKINPPVITTKDQAKLLSLIQAQLGLPQFHAVIGSSYGGMVALAFASLFPESLQKLVCIAAADHSSVKTQALRSIQRHIVKLGHQFAKDSDEMKQFVALARGLAMIGYRGEIEFEQRFQSVIPGEALQAVDSYLGHHGQRFAERFCFSRYQQLSKSIDLHQVDVSHIAAETLLIGIQSDQMVPVEFIQNMSQKIQAACQFHLIDSLYGHDGFLLEAEQINTLLNTFFSEHSHDYLERNHRSASGY